MRRLVRAITRFAARLFFRRIDSEGVADVPLVGPVILTPNHTNALVDPFVIGAVVPRPLTLTAKSTLAKNPMVKLLMWLLDVIALHRSQDRKAGSDPTKNVDALAECRRRLAGGATLCIFPEGVSHSDPKMREFKTGAARVALDFVREHPHAGLKIVPVGLHYEAKERPRSDVLIRFGEPIDVAAWVAEHSEETQPRKLTELIEDRVEALTQNFERQREALLVRWAADVVAAVDNEPIALGRDETTYTARVAEGDRLQHAYERLSVSRPEEVRRVVDALRLYRRELKELGVENEEVWLPLGPWQAAYFVLRELELLLFGTPMALIGALQHGLPGLLVAFVARKLSVDRDHWASNVVIPGLFAFPFFWLLETLVVTWRCGFWWAAAFALSLPFTLTYAVLWSERVGGSLRRVRSFFRLLIRRDSQRKLQREARAIRDEIAALVNVGG